MEKKTKNDCKLNSENDWKLETQPTYSSLENLLERK
jgi:hypothetical protein